MDHYAALSRHLLLSVLLLAACAAQPQSSPLKIIDNGIDVPASANTVRVEDGVVILERRDTSMGQH